jgi:monovalent cation:proton antiporter-2 (CPA2) family protein
MYGEGFFFQAFIYLTAAVVSVPIAKRLGMGSVLGYLIAGVTIGPFGLQLLGEEGKDVMHFAEFGVVMMLFLVGLELQPSRLWRLRGPILGMGGLQLGATASLIMVIGIVIGLPWQSSLAIGLILALSSTAIVLQTLNEKGLLKTDGGQNSFSVLLFQDIAVIPLMAFLPLLAVPGNGALAGGSSTPAGHGTTWIEGLPGWAQTLVLLATVAAVIVGGRFLVRPVFRVIAKTRLRELFTATALLLVIGIALLMTRVGLSPALGTFLAGVVLAESEYRHELESDIEPFKGLLLGLFFIAVGASIDFGLVSGQPGLIVGLVCALILVKFAVLIVLGRFFRMGFDQNLLLAFSLAQGGEFAFVLFSFAQTDGVLPEELTGLLMAVVAISMPLTPLLMMLNDKLIQPRFGTRESQTTKADTIDEENPVIIAGFGRFGNIVGRLLRANGVRATVLDLDSDNVEMLRNLGLKVFYGDATRHDLLHAAGATKATLLILALDDPEKNYELLHTARRHFPHLTVLARASGRSDAYELIEAGVDHVYRETLDASLRLGVEALRLLGFPSHQAHRASLTFRRHDENALRELAAMRHDRKGYISLARQRISDLEALLLEEMGGELDLERDTGWDTTSLREEVASKAQT